MHFDAVVSTLPVCMAHRHEQQTSKNESEVSKMQDNSSEKNNYDATLDDLIRWLGNPSEPKYTLETIDYSESETYWDGDGWGWR